MKILVLAFECDPRTNSEPGIAACWVQSYLDDGHDVVLFTHGTQSGAKSLPCEVLLSDEELTRPTPTVEFIGALKNSILYRKWLARASELLARRGGEFDLIHHISWSSVRLRSPLLGYTGQDEQYLVWGPLGGGHLAPWRWCLRGPHLFEIVRNLSVKVNALVSLRRSPSVVFVACNDETMSLLRRRGGVKLLSMSADLLRSDQIASEVKQGGGDAIRLLWVGRMVASKRPDVAIYALRSLLQGGHNARLEFAGTGLEGERLMQLAEKLSVSENVTWLGWVNPADMAGVYRRNDVLLYTSVRDSGWPSALEAAAQGTPSIGVDHQGFGANYEVSFAAFADADPGATAEVMGVAFARAAMVVYQEDYEAASSDCLRLAHHHEYSGRAVDLVGRLGTFGSPA